MSRRDVTVVLNGEGADELFGGYLTYRADRYGSSRRHSSPAGRTALSCARLLPVTDAKIGLEYKVKRFLEGSLVSGSRPHILERRIHRGGKARYLITQTLCRYLASWADAAGKSLERYLDFDQPYSLPDGMLYKVDRMSMAHSVEVRPPFLDDRIVDFAARLA